MPPPSSIFTLTPKIFLQVRPYVHEYLGHWIGMAERISDPELRKQALASIAGKTFHCEGGSIYGLLAGGRYPEAIRFIVAYQTISDYLDNLCDRSTSRDPDDFRTLHVAMRHALTPGAATENYYRRRAEQDDGGYLTALVESCQASLAAIPDYGVIAPYLHELADYYCDLQVRKHAAEEERVKLVQAWFDEKKDGLPAMSWYEFAACTGSTVGIFCLIAYAFRGNCSLQLAKSIKDAYFPWVQGLHILLDYLIDQEEDLRGGDLNFCSYYRNHHEAADRISIFFSRADAKLKLLPDAGFHRLINCGLLGIYFADKKVYPQEEVRKIAGKMILQGGYASVFFYCICWIYRRLAACVPHQNENLMKNSPLPGD